MAGRYPKPPEQRRRRNKPPVSGEKLSAGAGIASRPDLPGAEGFLAATVGWWETVWASPMAAVWLEADVPALVRLALLIEAVGRGDVSAALLAEIRQLEDRFGLSPLARRRLQWEIEKAAGPAEGGAAPRDDGRWLRAVSG